MVRGATVLVAAGSHGVAETLAHRICGIVARAAVR
ncbi:MAG: hypothetical protein QOG45_3003 [Chloroflexota bacterium]|jgi:hypothetical protein|nr:hypothetical protein [Chloroflexota bacterium]